MQTLIPISTNLRNQTIQPNEKVPFEIWDYILCLASLLPGKDEFSQSSEAFDMKPRDRTKYSAHLTPRELSHILKSRFTIVQVCRAWYDMGIQTLWSHWRIDMAELMSQLLSLEDTYAKKPRLISYIVRLTVLGEPPTKMSWDPSLSADSVSAEVLSILSSISNLRVLSCPFGRIAEHLPNHLECAWIDSTAYRKTVFLLNPNVISAWSILRVLNINCQGMGMGGLYSVLFQGEIIFFPRLEAFRLRVTPQNLTLPASIAARWHFPVLRILSLAGGSVEFLVKLLVACRQTIQELDLSNLENNVNPVSLEINMVALSSLSMDVKDSGIWSKIIRSKSLRNTSIFNVDFVYNFKSVRRAVIKTARDILATFPTIKALHIYELGQHISPYTRYGLSKEDLDLIGGGIATIRVHHDARGQMQQELQQTKAVDVLNDLFAFHPGLYSTEPKKKLSISNQFIPPDFLYRRSIYSLGKYQAIGKPAITREESKNNAASVLIGMIREDVL